jgi:hypothetical protein
MGLALSRIRRIITPMNPRRIGGGLLTVTSVVAQTIIGMVDLKLSHPLGHGLLGACVITGIIGMLMMALPSKNKSPKNDSLPPRVKVNGGGFNQIVENEYTGNATFVELNDTEGNLVARNKIKQGDKV